MNQPNQIAEQDFYLDAAKTKLVEPGEKAAFLWARKGDEIPASACEKFGIVDGKLPEKKGGKKPANKGGSTPANKGGSTPPNKGGSKPDDKVKEAQLTDIKGIGPTTAGALVTAGVKDVAALAAVDPENPPSVETLPPSFSWPDVVEAAKEATADGGGE